MSRKKKKRPTAPEKMADMGDETARDAAIQEDAARSGDSDALNAEPIADGEEAEAEPEEAQPTESPPKPPSLHALRKAAREAAYARADVFRKREPTLTGREAMKQARIRRHAARQLGTPNRYDTGLPRRRHPVRSLRRYLWNPLRLPNRLRSPGPPLPPYAPANRFGRCGTVL